jgi:hypothetical protein
MAFRSVPRPSSPPGAKASTECPSHAQDNPCTETILSINKTVTPRMPSQRPSLIQHTTVPPLNTAPLRAGFSTHRSDMQRPHPETYQNLIHPDKDQFRPRSLSRPDTTDPAGLDPRPPEPDFLSSFTAIRQPIATSQSRPGLVETIGFEPTTPCLQSRCSPS